MNGLVLCPREKGNTRKVCDAIAARPGWKLARISGADRMDLSGYDRVIIGSGVYGGRPHKNVIAFLEALEKGQGPREIRILLTWVGRGRSDRAAFRAIEKICVLRGISVHPKYHSVLGHSFGVFWPGRPNAEDMAGSVAWAEA